MNNVVSPKGFVVDVKSTMVETIAFCTESSILWVKFKNSVECYEYEKIGANVAERLRTASSHGEFMNSTIKPGWDGLKRPESFFDAFCKMVIDKSVVVPIVNINWAAVTAAADQMVWR